MKFINNEKILENTKSGTIMHNNVKSEQHVQQRMHEIVHGMEDTYVKVF